MDDASSAALTAGRLTAFSILGMSIYAAQVPIGVYVPAILAQRYGLPLTALGLIFFVTKSWGVLADPLVGMLSDRTRSRFGRRRSWVLAGGAVFGVSTMALLPRRSAAALSNPLTARISS